MKKFINKLKNPIKTKENFFSVCSNEPPEADNKKGPINSSKIDVYKNFKFDSSDIDHCVDSYLETLQFSKLVKKDLNKNGMHSLSNSQSEYLNQENNTSTSDLSERQRKKSQSSTQSVCSDGTDVFDESDISSKQEKSKLFNEKETSKSRNNTYVIKITNSKNFYIGSQKTVSFGENVEKNALSITCSQMQSNSCEKESMKDLLNSKKTLTEEDITLISLHIDDKWKEFGKNLGIQESLLNQLEERNDNNKILITYDILQKLVKEFPYTSLGFVTNALNKSNQLHVIEKLIENNKQIVAAQ